MYAVKNGHYEIVDFLLKSKANITQKDNYNRTALMYVDGNIFIMKLLEESSEEVEDDIISIHEIGLLLSRVNNNASDVFTIIENSMLYLFKKYTYEEVYDFIGQCIDCLLINKTLSQIQDELGFKEHFSSKEELIRGFFQYCVQNMSFITLDLLYDCDELEQLLDFVNEGKDADQKLDVEVDISSLSSYHEQVYNFIVTSDDSLSKSTKQLLIYILKSFISERDYPINTPELNKQEKLFEKLINIVSKELDTVEAVELEQFLQNSKKSLFKTNAIDENKLIIERISQTLEKLGFNIVK